jgi:hypothetical protein
MTQAPQTPPREDFSGGPLEAIVAWKLRWMRPVILPVCVVVGAAVAVSGLYIGGQAFRAGEVLITLFELVAVMAGVFAALVALGRFRVGAGLALASCALAIGGGAVLTEPSLLDFVFSTRLDPVVLNGVSVRWFMVGRVGAAVLLAIGAGVTIWSRRPRESAWFLVRATLLGIPLVAMLAVLAVPSIRASALSLPALVRVIGVVIGFFVGLGLASAAGHCFLRSLEMGRLDDADNPSPAPPQSPRAAA